MKFMLIERLLLHMVYIEKYGDSMEENIILLRMVKRWDSLIMRKWKMMASIAWDE